MSCPIRGAWSRNTDDAGYACCADYIGIAGWIDERIRADNAPTKSVSRLAVNDNLGNEAKPGRDGEEVKDGQSLT
jgi:hypothetical protein